MEEEIEIWKECGETDRRTYYVSNFGRVKSVTKGLRGGKEKLLKSGVGRGGYLHVNTGKTSKIHVLVVLTFIGPRPEGLFIDHIDRNKVNNRLDNLRYCTPSENNENTDRYRSDILEIDPIERIRIRGKQRYEAKREDILEKDKKRREANKEVIKENQKKYREANLEKIKKYDRNRPNKVERTEKIKEYYHANKEKISNKRKEKYTCGCGSTLSKGNKSAHKKTQTHLDWLATQT